MSTVHVRTQTRKIVRNFGFLISGRAIGDASMLVLLVVLSREFGQEGVGQYTFAVGFTGMFAVVTDFGLYAYSVKELGRHPHSFSEHFGNILQLRLVLAIVTLALLFLVVPFLSFSTTALFVIVSIGAFQIISLLVEVFSAAFVAHEESFLAGFLDGFHRSAASLAAVAAVFAGASLVQAVALMPIMAFVFLIIALWLVTKHYGYPRMSLSISPMTSLARNAFAYAGNLIIFHFNSRMDVVLLGFILSTAAAGVYNVGFRLVFVVTFIPEFAATALLPTASSLFRASSRELDELYHNSLSVSILVAVPVGAGLWIIAPQLIELIFGSEFADAANVLRILAALAALSFVSRLLGTFMLACDMQAQKVHALMIVAGVNLAGSLILIPTLGIRGAAISTVIAEVLLVMLYGQRLKKLLGLPKIGSRLAISVIGAAVFIVPFTLLPAQPLHVVVPASTVLYLAILALIKETRNNELKVVVAMLKRNQ